MFICLDIFLVGAGRGEMNAVFFPPEGFTFFLTLLMFNFLNLYLFLREREKQEQGERETQNPNEALGS